MNLSRGPSQWILSFYLKKKKKVMEIAKCPIVLLFHYTQMLGHKVELGRKWCEETQK